MSEFNGTKGNWAVYNSFEEPLVSELNGEVFKHLTSDIQVDGGRIIANVMYATDIENGGWGSANNLDEMRANAKLIAAAPELLKALQGLYGVIDSCIDLTPDVLIQADNAINKALGE